VPPFGEVTIIGRFTDNHGRYVFHCHNLIHEDAGMMAQFDAVPPGVGAGTPAGDAATATQHDHEGMTMP
jgi:hypothetical protein